MQDKPSMLFPRKHTITHNVVQNVFAFIAKDVGFHILHEQTHVLLSPPLQYLCWSVDIMLNLSGVHLLVNLIIIDPKQI
jgi:hypothetical protein